MTKQEAIGASQTANLKSVMTVRATAKEWTRVKAQALYRSDEVFDGDFHNNYMWTCIVYDRICII